MGRAVITIFDGAMSSNDPLVDATGEVLTRARSGPPELPPAVLATQMNLTGAAKRKPLVEQGVVRQRRRAGHWGFKTVPVMLLMKRSILDW